MCWPEETGDASARKQVHAGEGGVSGLNRRATRGYADKRENTYVILRTLETP